MNQIEKIKAEIKRLKNELIQEVEKGYKSEFDEGRISAFEDMIVYIDTLEVKEVDLEKEIEKEWLNCDLCRENTILEYANMDIKKFRTIAKHFFELGLKAKGE